MSDPHLGFIIAAYAITAVAVGFTVAAIVLRHRALRRALARFETARGR